MSIELLLFNLYLLEPYVWWRNTKNQKYLNTVGDIRAERGSRDSRCGVMTNEGKSNPYRLC